MDEPRIRRAAIDDAPAIAAVHVTVSREIYADLMPPHLLDAFSVDTRTRQWRDMIGGAEPSDAVYVAERGASEIVGFGCCGTQRSPELAACGFNGEFQTVYLLAGARRHGLGRALMAAMARH